MRKLSIEAIREIIKIDDTRDNLLTKFGKITLKDRYCLPGEGYQDVFARASVAFCGGDLALAQRLYDYASKQWLSFATPLIANGGCDHGLPISCFLNYVDDSIDGLTENFVENAFLATAGGGIGSYWGNVRSTGEMTSKGVKTPGALAFMHTIDSQMLAYHQGSTRRGAAAVYMDLSHPEIIEFIEMRSSTGGDIHRKNENLHHGVCITDEFMRAVENDGYWQLIDPNSGILKETIKARNLWIRILQARVKSGEPYLFFIDTTNAALPQSQKDLGLKVHHSNLCTEITLPTSTDRTAVCCLSSLNLAKFDEWRDEAETFIYDVIEMLDNVITVFIDEAPAKMWRAVNSARKERSLGLGTLGWFSFLQQHSMSIESSQAAELNIEIFHMIKSYALKASKDLAKYRGEPDDMKGTGLRNAHLLSIAPNASTSIICGVSPSVEPFAANAFSQKTQSGTHEVRNMALVPVLENYGKNDDETWSSIIINEGSVQHLHFLTEQEKAVFKTALEINQGYLVELAADRQPFICQAQSINIFLPPDISTTELHKLHFLAWKKGLKSLYYLRSKSVKSAEKVSNSSERIIREEAPAPVCTDDVCTMCAN